MTRIRTVKPEFFRHEALFDLEERTELPIRLAFIGLWGCCDREGRFEWRPRALKLDVLPYDEIDFAAVLDALAEGGFIIRYTHGDKVYGWVPSWKLHQHINMREQASRLPAYEARARENATMPNKPLTMPNSMSDVKTSIALEKGIPTSFIDDKKDILATPSSTVDNAMAFTAIDTVHPVPTASLVEAAAPTTITMASVTTPDEIRATEEAIHQHETSAATSAPQHNLAASSSRACETFNGDRALDVFTYWKNKTEHDHAHFDDKRRQLIEDALNVGYQVEDLCCAIDGCCLTPFNMGHNEQGARYLSIPIILRDPSQIDRFIANAKRPPQPKPVSDKRNDTNRQAILTLLTQLTTNPSEDGDPNNNEFG